MKTALPGRKRGSSGDHFAQARSPRDRGGSGREIFIPAPGKWFSLTCLLLLIVFADPRIVYPSPESVPGPNTAEAPPDYGAMRLVGAMQVGRSAVVVFENSKGEQSYYPVGRTFADGSRITAVKDKSIMVERADGSVVEYFVSPGEAGKPASASVGRPVTTPPPAPSYTPPAPGPSENERRSKKKRRTAKDSEDEE